MGRGRGATDGDGNVVPLGSTAVSHARRGRTTTPARPSRHGASATVTLKDVAAAVGVSQSAVSMALAGNPRISESTRAAVRHAVRELGYVPNSAGRALRAGRSRSIAVIVPNTGQHVFGHPYFMRLLVGVTHEANERDAPLIISTNPDESHGVAAYERVLRSHAAAGAIVASAAVNDPNVMRMVDAALPVVLIGRFPHLANAVSVGIDEFAAAKAITAHLVVDHGFTRLAHISGPLDHQTAIDRFEGFRSALIESGSCTHTLAVGDFSEESGRAAAAQILDSMSDVAAIFAANDEMAYGALTEIRSRGLRIPEDIALAGFDDFGVSRLTTPAITTMHVPAEEIGRQAATLLFERFDRTPISSDDRAPTRNELSAELVLRESCGLHPT